MSAQADGADGRHAVGDGKVVAQTAAQQAVDAAQQAVDATVAQEALLRQEALLSGNGEEMSLTVALCFSDPIYGIREIAKVKQDSKLLSKTYSEILLIQVGWLIVSMFIYGGWIYFSNTFVDEPIIRWVSFLHIIGIVGLVHWFYQGIENYQFITINMNV